MPGGVAPKIALHGDVAATVAGVALHCATKILILHLALPRQEETQAKLAVASHAVQFEGSTVDAWPLKGSGMHQDCFPDVPRPNNVFPLGLQEGTLIEGEGAPEQGP